MLFRAGVQRLAIIKKLADQEISQLDDLISVLSKLSRGARAPLEYVGYVDRHRRKSVLVTVDRHEWYAPPQIYTRDDSTGLWTTKPAFQPDASIPPSGIDNPDGTRSLAVPLCSEASSFEDVHHVRSAELVEGVTSMETNYEHDSEGGHPRDESDVETKKRRVKVDFSADANVLADGSFLERNEGDLEDSNTLENSMLGDFQGANLATANSSVAERVIEPTLVMLEVHVPPSCMRDGVHSQHFFGTGVAIYHSQNMGVIAVDKNTVAISSSYVMLSFAAFPIEIPGEVLFLHPVHNYALISYDPSALGTVGISLVRAAELLPESVALIEDIVIEYITDLVHKARDTGSNLGKLSVEEFLYLIRKDPPKLNYCKSCSMNEERKQARKAVEIYEENLRKTFEADNDNPGSTAESFDIVSEY